MYVNNWLPVWIENYGTDLLCMPIILTLVLVGVRLIKKDDQLVLPLFSILIITIFWSVYFEYYLPQKSDGHTADIWDVVMYTTGSVAFIVWQKMKAKKPLHPSHCR